MASAVPKSPLERLRSRPLRGAPLAGLALGVWLIGAVYCSGYERLLSGIDNWVGSLWWSAAAVLPWLALFEWSKSPNGRRITRSFGFLVLTLCVTAAASIALELAIDVASGAESRPLLLLMLRRLPAAGSCLVLILWSRGAGPPFKRRTGNGVEDEGLSELAGSIDWIAAADNYIEMHIGGRVSMRRMTLRDAESVLCRFGFVRIHRRYLVNRASVQAVDQIGDGPAVELKDGTKLPCGKAFAAKLLQLQ